MNTNSTESGKSKELALEQYQHYKSISMSQSCAYRNHLTAPHPLPVPEATDHLNYTETGLPIVTHTRTCPDTHEHKYKTMETRHTHILKTSYHEHKRRVEGNMLKQNTHSHMIPGQ